MEGGWIKIHRKLLEWEWADDPNMVALWIHLLLNANFYECEWHGITIPKGAFKTTQAELCGKTGLSRSTLRTCMERLKATGEITTKTIHNCTIVIIRNYDKYQ